MKLWIKRLLAISGTAASLMTVHLYLCFVFFPKKSSDPRGHFYVEHGYVAEKKDTIDVMALGNSNLRYGFNPMYLYGRYGITSYNGGTDIQGFDNEYSQFKEATENQNIKVLLLETDSLFSSIGWRMAEDKKGPSFLLTPFFNHAKWKNLTAQDLLWPFSFDKKEKYYQKMKGYAVKTDKALFSDTRKSVRSSKQAKPTNRTLRALSKILKLAKAKKTKVILYTSPSVSTSDEQMSYCVGLAKRLSLPYYNFNDLYKGTSFSFSKHLGDATGTHCNLWGASVVTEFLYQQTLKPLNLQDRRTDLPRWNEDFADYKTDLAKHGLSETGE